METMRRRSSYIPEKYGDRYNKLMLALKKAGVKILNNGHVNYKKNGELIHIYGLEIGKEFFLIRNRPPMKEDYISGLIGMALDGYGILIAHNPMFFKQYAAVGSRPLYFRDMVHGRGG